MDKNLLGGADTRPVVLCAACIENERDTKELGVYFRVRKSEGLTSADYLFQGVRKVGVIAVVVMDLRGWDCDDTLMDSLDVLQRAEERFVARARAAHAKYGCAIAAAYVGKAHKDVLNSRQRFMKVQDSLLNNQGSQSSTTVLMVLPVDKDHRMAGELAELRYSF